MTRRLQQLIHVGCRELRISAEDRRAMQLRLTGCESMSGMTEAQLELVVDELKAKGFKPKGGRKPAASRRDLRLIHVIWRKLGAAGALDRPGRDGLNAFIRSRFGTAWASVPADVDMLRDHEKIDAVIQALKSWADRVGVELDLVEANRR